MRTLSNGILEIAVSEHGAELQSLKKVSCNREYIWDAQPEYWGKHAPVLFPIIGRTHNKQVSCKGVTYPMEKHGFAKDLEYMCEESDRLLTFRASDTDATRTSFPYAFHLEVSYRLSRNKLIMGFRVENPNEEVLPFKIGGHPAFYLPKFQAEDAIHGYLSFNDVDSLQSNKINANGHWMEETFEVPLEKGMLPLKNDTFLCDTILETRGIINRTSLYDKNKKPILTVKAQAPAIAYWAPSDKPTPFVCIEPWFGCCMSDQDSNEMLEQKMVNLLPPHEVFEAEIEIIVEE